MTSVLDLLNGALVDAVASPWILLIVFAVCVVDGLFPPVPSETVVVAAAVLGISTGALQPWIVVLLAAAGAFAGDALTYAIGRAIGVRRFRWMRTRRAAATIAWAQRSLERRGASLILIARYIPVGRVAVNITAGATGYPRRRFLPLAALAAVAWAVYSVAIGVLAGHWLGENPLLGVAVGVAIAVLLGLIVDRLIALRRRRISRAASPSPGPRERIPAS
jgi:membrane protein DedA with SNARE-associated domain